MKIGTLVFIVRDGKMLLAMKKVRFGSGNWNGAGGKVTPEDASIQAAAVRETQEEIGVTPVLGEPFATLHYHEKEGEWIVHVFRTDSFSGEPTESEEMRPEWFPLDALPLDHMWDGDKLWLDRVISGQPFEAEIWYDDDHRVIRHEIRNL